MNFCFAVIPWSAFLSFKISSSCFQTGRISYLSLEYSSLSNLRRIKFLLLDEKILLTLVGTVKINPTMVFSDHLFSLLSFYFHIISISHGEPTFCYGRSFRGHREFFVILPFSQARTCFTQ